MDRGETVRSFFVIFLLFILCSCAKNEARERAEAIDVALSYLSDGECEEAIKLLEKTGRSQDAVFLQVLASAYACRAGFDAVRFISEDIEAIDTDSSQLLNSLTLLTLSGETETDSDSYTDLKTAIFLLLNSAKSTQPSQAYRTSTFGPRKAGDIGVQALLLSIVQLGKFLNHYGNVDANGDKGAGDEANRCFITYSSTDAQVVAAVGGGVCNGVSSGHVALNYATAAGRRRLCEGLMLFTNIIDILDNIDVSGNESLSDLEEVADAVKEYKTTAITVDPDLATLLNMTSQSLCETTLETASEMNNMQLIYASIFESGLQ